jgi:crotonobetaine/carnitine-CoA ligase
VLAAPCAVAQWASDTPDATAVEHVEGATCSYARLHQLAIRWAGAFRSIGVRPGDLVATLVDNGLSNYACWLGVAWSGAIEVPVNTQYFGEMLEHVLCDSGPSVVVASPGNLRQLEQVLPKVPSVKSVVVADVGVSVVPHLAADTHDAATLLAAADPLAEFMAPSYRDMACILYTSGTTGRSKGVLMPWALLYQIWSWVPAGALGAGDGLYCTFQMFHNSGKSALNASLVRGARFVYRDRFSAQSFWRDIRQTNARAATLVGRMSAVISAAPEGPDDADHPLESLLMGPLIPEIETFKRRFGVRVATCYSQTEVGTALTTGWEYGPWASCGRPRQDYPWTEVRIVNEHDERLPRGAVGELVVRTGEPWSLNAGYVGMPAETARAWRNGWFHTGDAFREDEDGWYYLVDRLVDTIRRRGENISSQEVEELVLSLEGVVECAAFSVAGDYNDEEIMLVVVPSADHGEFDLSRFHSQLKERIPKFMVPRYVEVMSSLPRNETTLRVKKHELRDRGITSKTWDSEQKPSHHPN